MKKIVYSLTMALVLCLVASCGLGSKPPHLTTEAGLDSVRTLILEEAGPDAKFTLLDIDGHTKRDDELGRISVISRTQVHLFSTFNWSWITSDAAEPSEEAHEVRVADLDFKPLLSGYEEVVRQVTERTSDIEAKNVPENFFQSSGKLKKIIGEIVFDFPDNFLAYAPTLLIPHPPGINSTAYTPN